MSRLIEKMRADFALVASVRIAAGVWNKGDESAAGAEIARLIKAQDEAGMLIWARWLGKLALVDLSVNASSPTPAVTARACAVCLHCAKPGRSEGYCAGREDLAKAYGKHHPLHVMPADGGASCARFSARAE